MTSGREMEKAIEAAALAMVMATAKYYGDAPPVNPDLTLTKILAREAFACFPYPAAAPQGGRRDTMNKLEKQMLSALNAALADITDTASITCGRYNRTTKKYESNDAIFKGSAPGSFKVVQKIRRAIAAAHRQNEGGE